MLLHIGGDFVIDSNEIVGVFDLDNTTVTKRGAEFINTAYSSGQVVVVDDNLPKSFVIVDRDEGIIIYITSLSVQTLNKRLESKYLALR